MGTKESHETIKDQVGHHEIIKVLYMHGKLKTKVIFGLLTTEVSPMTEHHNNVPATG
jgi:hypothetical protein